MTKIADKPLQNLCMLMALDMGAADAIVSRNGATVSTSELAAELKYDELLISKAPMWQISRRDRMLMLQRG